MMATGAFVDHLSPPQSLLLYPTLIDQTTLNDLAPLARNRNYHAYRDALTRIQLDQSILANALITRLTSILYCAHTILARFFVNIRPSCDNSSDFSMLNETTQELQKAINNKYTSSIRNILQPAPNIQLSSGVSSLTSFFDELSPTASNTLLNFLSTLRTDPNFLSSRLLQAKDQELDSLVSRKPHHHYPRQKSISGGRHNITPASPASPTDYVASFHRHDPLYILTSVIFSSSSDSSSREYQRRLNTWSSCLAQLIDEKRGESTVLAVLDLFCDRTWKVASSFEITILSFLQNAAKLGSGKSKYEDVCENESVFEADSELADLCDKTLNEILGMTNDVGGIPSFALEVVNDVFRKSVDKDQAKLVLFAKWFIEHFLCRHIISPEVFIFMFAKY
jgi:hypothetical protein